jgi:hypothetical protein
MGRFAKVGSVDTLRELRSHLCTFAHIAGSSLEEANSDIQRTLIWLKQDRYRYWKVEARKRQEQYGRAKLELKRKQDLETSPLGGTYSFIDEKKAVAVAQRAWEEAEQKLQNIQRWVPQLEREAFAFQGISQGLMELVDVEVPNSCALLDRMIDSLEAYLKLAPEAAAPDSGTGSLAEGMTEGEGISSMTRSIDSLQSKPEIDFVKLRKMVLFGDMRKDLPLEETVPTWLGARMGIDVHNAIKAMGKEVPREKVSGDAKVVIADLVEASGPYFLVHGEAAELGDSGWYISAVKEGKKTGHRAVRVGKLLQQRSDLEEILRLPMGTLVVIEDDSIRAIVDGQDQSFSNDK